MGEKIKKSKTMWYDKYKVIEKLMGGRIRKHIELPCSKCEVNFIRRIDVHLKCNHNVCLPCIHEAKKQTALRGSDNPDFVPFQKCMDCGRTLTSKISNKIIRCKDCFNNFHVGSIHPNWKGGLTSEERKIRHSKEYKKWAKAVKERDNYTCQMCNKPDKKAHADHIKPFCEYPELRLVMGNGRALCADCHYKYGWSLFRDRNPRKKGDKGCNNVSVYCVNTNKVYDSQKEAATKLGVDRSCVNMVLSGKRVHTRGYKFIKLTDELLIF